MIPYVILCKYIQFFSNLYIFTFGNKQPRGLMNDNRLYSLCGNHTNSFMSMHLPETRIERCTSGVCSSLWAASLEAGFGFDAVSHATAILKLVTNVSSSLCI